MSSGVSLPVLLPAIPGQRWSCHSCGQCCRSLVGHLLPADKARLDAQRWGDRLDVPPYVRAGGSWVLNKRPDGGCVFLDEQSRCRIHAEFGESEKPLACRIFPFSVRAVPGAWRASLRYDCPSVTSSKGAALREHRSWVTELVAGLPHTPPRRGDTARLGGGAVATAEELDAVRVRVVQRLRNDGRPLRARLLALGRITTTLARAKLARVRGERFVELLDILFEAPEHEFAAEPAAPNERQRGMLRQSAFAHAEHVTLAEMRAGFIARLRTRWAQFGKAQRFLGGVGEVPRLPGFGGGVDFEQVERVAVPDDAAAQGEPLLARYLVARLEGGTTWGRGYYGWDVFPGLGALWLSVATVGWLARLAAAGGGRESVDYDDIATALGIVDRAATRVPSLGSASERIRMRYLMDGDGLAALVGSCAPIGAAPV